MKLSQIIELLDARIICGDDLDLEIKTACGSDLMSDVLAFFKEQSMMLTGLLNPQCVRTAEMLDMHCVTFVRGKIPGDDVIALAKERNIVLLSTKYRMFSACGILYSAGLSGGCEDSNAAD